MQLWRCAWQNKYFISRLFLFLCCKFLPCIFQPAGQGILLGPTGLFPALCDQRAKIAIQSRMRHGLWVSDAPTVLASSIHVEPWTVITVLKAILHWDWMRRVSCVMRPAVQHSLPQAVGFRCAHCASEFDTRHAMDCHRRKQSSLGTGCADPSNSKSVSYTGRASISSSIIREHDVLGALTIHSNISHGDRKCTYTVASFQINV